MLAPTKPKTIAETVLELLAKQRRDGSWTKDAVEQLMTDLGDRLVVRLATGTPTPTEVVLDFFKSDAVATNAILAAIVARAVARADAFLSSKQ